MLLVRLPVNSRLLVVSFVKVQSYMWGEVSPYPPPCAVQGSTGFVLQELNERLTPEYHSFLMHIGLFDFNSKIKIVE